MDGLLLQGVKYIYELVTGMSTMQGLIFGLMVLGVYITYRILDFPDLSVDGTFPLGGAVAAALITQGVNPIVATLVAVFAGFLAGGITGLLHVKLKITNLLSGILVMIGLYSINLRIMGKSNTPLFQSTTVFSTGVSVMLLAIIFVVAGKVILDLFLKTKLGYLVKATGDNPQLVTSLGMDIGKMKIFALMVSNGFVALSGALLAQQQGYADVSMGTGVVVTGLASVILGQAIFKKLGLSLGKKKLALAASTMVIFGSIIYRWSIQIALDCNLEATDMKLVTAVIVIVALGVNNTKGNSKLKGLFSKYRGGEGNAKFARVNKNLQ